MSLLILCFIYFCDFCLTQMNQPLLQTKDVNLHVSTFIAFPLPLRKLIIVISSSTCHLRSGEFVTRQSDVSNILSLCKWPEHLFSFLLWVPVARWDNNVKKRWSYRCKRPWRPIVLWDLEAPTFSRQSAPRWWCASRSLPLGRILVLISVRGLVDSRATVRLEGLGQLKNQMTYRESNLRPSGL
jgi:hypothetical protein